MTSDTKLFIDPCLISISQTSFSREAKKIIDDYFDHLFNLYKNNSSRTDKLFLFEHSHEINATKLGYGNGKNGKAKTAEGMVETLASLEDLFKRGIHVSEPIDLPIFIKDFAEDCLSDMLTNILFKCLNQYTIEQLSHYGIKPQMARHKYYYWDIKTHSWEVCRECVIQVNGEGVLLVPKDIVCKGYYYNSEQYFRMIISERLQKEQTTFDPKTGKENVPHKKDIKEDELRIYDNIKEIDAVHTSHDPSSLDEYHLLMPQKYANRSMSDEELDYLIYGKNFS